MKNNSDEERQKVTKPKYTKGEGNTLLKTPRTTKAEMIYQAVNEYLSTGDGNFIPTWDDTDHFHFCCGSCACIADILQVKFYPNYSGDWKGTKLYAFFIYLGCPMCGLTGFRKIYLKPRNCIGQKAFANEKQLYIFGVGKEAIEKISFEQTSEQEIDS